MLPGFRAVIAGILVTIVLPLVAFGIAANFRNANGMTFSPRTTPATGPALIEYYWSQFYAPTQLHPDELRAEAEAREAAATRQAALVLNETFKIFDVPPVAPAPPVPPAPQVVEPPKPVEAAPPTQAAKPAEAPTAEIVAPLESPKAPERIARLPDTAIEPQPTPPPAVTDNTSSSLPLEMPSTAPQMPNTAPSPAEPASVAALMPPQLKAENEHLGRQALTGRIPLPPKRPTVKRPARSTSTIIRRNRHRDFSGDRPFVPLNGSLFEQLFGGVGKS